MAIKIGTTSHDIIIGTAGIDLIAGFRGNDILDGGDGDDLVYGGSGDDTIDGGTGNDALFGGRGSDLLVGGDGDDLVYGGSGDDTIDGGTGNDVLFGGRGSDLLVGGDGSDLIFGGSGDDVIDAGSGNDTVSGGRGDDRFFFEAGSGLLLITDFHAGAGTDDVIVLRNTNKTSLAGVLELAQDIGNDTVIHFENGDRLILLGVKTTDLHADDFEFETKSTEGDDVIISTNGDDVIDAGGGDDEIIYTVGDGVDIVDGGEGMDAFVLQGIDTAQTGVLIEDGTTYAARTGDLTFATDHIAMSVNGQLVADLDNIEDLVFNAGALGDTVEISGDFSGTDLAPETIRINGGIKKEIIDGRKLTELATKKIAFVVKADRGDDEIKTASGRDVLAGEDGNDVLDSGSGNDVLIGGAGDDSLDGGDDDDTAIYGSTETDSTRPVDSVLGYDITIGAGIGAATIVDTDPSNGDDGTDELVRVEIVKFGDVTLLLDGLNNAPFIGASQLSGGVAELTEGDPNENQISHSAQGVIDFREFDRTLGHTVTAAPNSTNYRGELTVDFSDADTSDGAGQIIWTFSVDDSALDDLAEGQVLLQTYDVTIDDGNGGSATERVTITIDGANDAANNAPVAVGELIATDEDTVLSGRNLFADNGSGADFDPDLTDTFTINTVNGSSANVGQQITLLSGALLTVQSNGDLEFDPRGAFDFVPQGSSSADNITYTLIDQNGAVSNQALVNLSVTGVNDAPVAVGELIATDEDTVLSGRNLFADNGSGADFDPDLTDTFTINTVNGSSANVGQQITLLSGALLTVQSNGDLEFDPRGAFDFVPQGSSSADNITYTLIDQNGAVSNQALVNLSVTGVNDAPVAVGELIATDEDTVLSGRNLFADNGSGADFDPDLTDTFTINTVNGSSANVGQQITLLSGALLTVQSNGDLEFDPRGAFDFVPQGSSSADNITYTLIDQNGAVSNQALVNLSVTGVNDAPVAVGELIATDEDTVLSGRNLFADNGSGADFDPDLTDTFTINTVNGSSANVGQQITLLSGALLTVQSNGDLEFDPRGAFDFVPQGSSSADNITYTLIDQNGAVSNQALVNLSVTGVNDAPVAVGELIATDEDTVLSGRNLFADNGSGADFDPDLTDTFTINTVNGSSANVGQQITLLSGALLTVQSNGDLEFDPRGAFDFVPQGSSSADNITYTLIDQNGAVSNQALVNLSVTGVNDAPAVSGATTGDRDVIEDTDPSASGALTITDVDRGEDQFRPVAAAVPSAGGFGTYTVTAAGAWAYMLDNMNPTVQALSDGEVLGDSIVVVSADGTVATAVNITISGANEAVNLQPSYNISDIIAGTADLDGLVINGIDANDLSGQSVSGAGDVNGDGIDDVVIGANTADPDETGSPGQAYVVFGTRADFSSSLELSALNGINGFSINGIVQNGQVGFSVSGAGDINNDNVDDLIIASGSGNSSYVVFGSTIGFGVNGVLDLATLDGSNGFVIDPAGINIMSSVSGAGDVNGDGIDDLILGSPLADPGLQTDSGESYVVFGSTSVGGSGVLDLDSLVGTNGVALIGPDARDRSGNSVSGAGDINGDGIDDLIIGAQGADPNNDSLAGESYVVFGSTSGLGVNGVLDLATLDGINGLVINGINPSDSSGNSVSGVGDINGDGIDDLIIGAEGANGGRGESYVLFGSTSGLGVNGVLDLDSLNGANGFVVTDSTLGAFDLLGHSVSGAGDFNNDGLDDLIIGASQTVAGQSYLVFGSDSGFGVGGVLDLATLDGTNGTVLFGIDAGDGSGQSVSGAGDVNNDGFDDLIVSAFQADPNGIASGESYIIFGGEFASA